MDFLSLTNILMMTPILLLALPFHELAHGWVAYKMGDPTAKDAGRITMNPFKHLDLMGVIMMYVVGFGWAKPVPVNPVFFKDRRKGLLLVSLAGPMSNLLLAFISALIGGVIARLYQAEIITASSENMARFLFYLGLFFYILISVNISLAIFNLIPVPPLDGSRVLSLFVPEESYFRFAHYEQYVGLAFLAIAALFPSVITKFIGFFAKPLFRSITLFASTVLGLEPANELWTIMQGML
jgi:Zn-dependent protease